MSEQVGEGWGKAACSRKWHYFTEHGTSLCGKVGFFFGYREKGNDNSLDNCAECKKRLKKEQK